MHEDSPKILPEKLDLWPLQTGILKINAGFAEKKLEKVEIITRTPAEVRPSDFSLRFLAYKYLTKRKLRSGSTTFVLELSQNSAEK